MSPFDVFHRLVRQALGETDARPEPLDIQLFTAEGGSGSLVVKFFPEDVADSVHAVYVPAGVDDGAALVERLHAAVHTHEGLIEVTDRARQRALLGEFRTVLERFLATGVDPDPSTLGSDDDDDDADEGDESRAARIEFGPIEVLASLGATLDDADLVGDDDDDDEDDADEDDDESDVDGDDEDEEDDDDDAIDDDDEEEEDDGDGDEDGDDSDDEAAAAEDERPTFRALALDILSGVPRPNGSEPGLADAYEVWAYRHDPVSTVVLRFFDEGNAVVMGVLSARDATDTQRLLGAARQLLATKAPAHAEPDGSGKLSDLELLSTRAAMERLGRAIGVDVTDASVETTTDTIGEVDDRVLAMVDEIRRLDPRSSDPNEWLFSEIAEDVLERGTEALWSRRKERVDAPRIEIFEHAAHPGVLVLLDFPEPPDAAEAAAYFPELDDDTVDAIDKDVEQLLAARGFDGGDTLEEPPAPFVRVPTPQAIARLRHALDEIDAGHGSTIAYVGG